MYWYSCNKNGSKTTSADNSLRLIISHVKAKLVLPLPFSSSEICVLLDVRTENADFLFFFFLLMSYYLGIWRRNEEMQRDLSRKLELYPLLAEDLLSASNKRCKYPLQWLLQLSCSLGQNHIGRRTMSCLWFLWSFSELDLNMNLYKRDLCAVTRTWKRGIIT